MNKTEIEKALENATPEQILSLVTAMKRLALLCANVELKKALCRRLEKRLEAIECMPVSVRKSIQGQDSNTDSETKWPSISGRQKMLIDALEKLGICLGENIEFEKSETEALKNTT